MLSRNEILEASDLQKQEVSVPEWGGSVMVYGMTAGDKDTYEESMISSVKSQIVTLKDATARLCSLCCRDEDGTRLFTAEDIDALSEKSAVALNRISTVAQKLSGMGKGELEQIVKNSEEIRIVGSG